MAVGLLIDGEHKLTEQDIYYLVEIGDEPGSIGKLVDGITSIPHGSVWRISYEPNCEDLVVGKVRSYLHPHNGGEFEFHEKERNLVMIDDNESQRLFGWVYLVGARWLPENVS